MSASESHIDVRSALKQGLAQLREAHVPSFTLAAELLLLHVLGRDRTWLYAHPEEQVSSADAERFFALLARRAAGEPTQHLTGKQEFWGLEFEVTPNVLIPRPETEHVIEVALDRLAVRERRAGRKQTLTGEGLQIADICTVSCCIAIALAKELRGATIYATDISSAALAVAQRNAKRHSVSDRIHFLESNLLDGFTARDAANAGPSVVEAQHAAPLLATDSSSIPRQSPVTSHQSLLADLIAQATAHLKPGGILVLELGHNSLPAVQPLLDASTWTNIGVTNDLAGILRVLAAERT